MTTSGGPKPQTPCLQQSWLSRWCLHGCWTCRSIVHTSCPLHLHWNNLVELSCSVKKMHLCTWEQGLVASRAMMRESSKLDMVGHALTSCRQPQKCRKESVPWNSRLGRTNLETRIIQTSSTQQPIDIVVFYMKTTYAILWIYHCQFTSCFLLRYTQIQKWSSESPSRNQANKMTYSCSSDWPDSLSLVDTGAILQWWLITCGIKYVRTYSLTVNLHATPTTCTSTFKNK